MKQIKAGPFKCSEGIFVYPYFYVRGGNRFSVPHTRPKGPWGPPIFLYNGQRVPFRGVKRPRRGVDHPSTSSGMLRGDLYHYKLQYNSNYTDAAYPDRQLFGSAWPFR
jgi:hypothetical protein